MSSQPKQCPQCSLDIDSITLHHLAFCPRCQFPVKLLAEKYKIEWKLATGGFGVVYLASQLHNEQNVVVKLVKRELFDTPEAGVRFQREILITEALSSSNEHIVRYLDHGEDPDLGHFYVMEYLNGISLDEYLDEQDVIPYSDCFHIFRQICEALAIAHRQGVVHRDLKPENIFLIQHDDDPLFVKVLDFGIAKIIAGTTQASLTKGIIGTPNYLSPEQCLDGTIDGRSDIYAMGVILYELLTRTSLFPFQNEAMMSLLFRHINEAPTPLRQKRPDLNIPEDLDRVVLKALAKSPDDRYQTISEFWASLRAFAFLPIRATRADEAPVVRPQTPPPRRQPSVAYQATVDVATPPRGQPTQHEDWVLTAPPAQQQVPSKHAPAVAGSPFAVSNKPPAPPKILSKAPKHPIKEHEHPVTPVKPVAHVSKSRHARNLGLSLILVLILVVTGLLFWFADYRKRQRLARQNDVSSAIHSEQPDAGSLGNPHKPSDHPPDQNSPPTSPVPREEDQDSDDDDPEDEQPPARPQTPAKTSHAPQTGKLPSSIVRSQTPGKTRPFAKRVSSRRTSPVSSRQKTSSSALRTVGSCGADTDAVYRVWLKAGKPSASLLQISFYNCPSCRAQRQGSGHCLSIPRTQSQVRLRIKAEGFLSCRISLHQHTRTWQWNLKNYDPDSLIDENYLCLSKLP